MLEIQLLSLFVGSLGLQVTIASRWLRWQQAAAANGWEEEETLTPYESSTSMTVESQSGFSVQPKASQLVGWEFKIVRANQDLFRDPAVFQRLCEEEAQAGWMLLEKLDDRRVRFKRPAAVRDIIAPESLTHDPYRTHYGPTLNRTIVLGAIVYLTAILLPAYLGYALVSTTLANTRLNSAPPPAAKSTR